MTVFVAGASGAIGLPLVRALAGAGHEVVAATRSTSKVEALRQLGAAPVVVDALDAASLERAVREAAPTHVVHELTSLPRLGPHRAADLGPTNRLREEGTRNLLRAAIAARARRIVVGSFAPLGAASALADDRMLGASVRAVRSMESQVLDAARRGEIEGVVLRYGLFYGPGNPATEQMLALVRRRRLPGVWRDHGRLPFIHIDDAVMATAASLHRGSSGEVYDIVDDHPVSFSQMVRELADAAGAPQPFLVPRWVVRLSSPYFSRVLGLQLSLSNADARRDLGWAPRFPSCREGFREAVATSGRRP